MNIVIRGSGVSAYCCAHLLRKAGLDVELRLVDRPRVPALMLSDAAVSLMRDVFDLPDLFIDAPRIQARVSSWGNGRLDPLHLDHSAIVLSEQELLRELSPVLPAAKSQSSGEQWTIYTSTPLPVSGVEKRFGSRVASAIPVELRSGSDPMCCWIESLESGWLFLIPNSGESDDWADCACLRWRGRRVLFLPSDLCASGRIDWIRIGMARLRRRGDGLRPHLRRWNRARGSGGDPRRGRDSGYRRRRRSGGVSGSLSGTPGLRFPKALGAMSPVLPVRLRRSLVGSGSAVA
jgi:hypothetical protein